MKTTKTTKTTRRAPAKPGAIRPIGSDGPAEESALRQSARTAFVDAGPAVPAIRRPAPTLKRLVAPLSIDTFLGSIWGKAHAIFRHPARRAWATGLVCRDILERGLDDRRLPQTSVGVIEPGGLLSGQAPAAIARALDLRHASGGRSIAFSALHVYEPRVRDTCLALERELMMPVRASAIFSAAATVTRPAHDATSALVIQLEGTRRWALYGAPGNPPSGLGAKVVADPGEPTDEIVLRPGDALYLPRGLVHQSGAGKSGSLHLTLALRELTWHDALAWLGKDALLQCSEDIFFRRSCPTREEAWSKDDVAYLDEALARFRRAFRLDRLDDLLEDLYLSESSVGEPEMTFSYGQLSTEIGPTTRLVQNPLVFFARKSGDHLILKFANKKMLFPTKISAAFDWVTQHETFRVAEIPGLGTKSQLVLAKRLVREGFLAGARA